MQSSERVVSPGSIRSLRRDLRRIERALDRGLKSPAGPGCCGLGIAQCHALLEIEETGIPLSSLAEELDLDASTLTRTLDGLERSALIRREDEPGDRRRLRATLTPQGRAKMEEIDVSWNGFFAEALERIDPGEREAVLRAIRIFAEALKERKAHA